MHTIQYIATQADDTDHAFRSVKDYLETLLGDGESINTWYDWFVTGGGRWASGEDNQYNDEWTGDVAHQSSPKFQEYLDTAHKYKLEAVEADLKYARDINISEILNNIENDLEGLYPMYAEASALYPFSQLYKNMVGMWGPDSYFFDIENDTTHPTYMREGIDKGDNNWYIVPVDFHF